MKANEGYHYHAHYNPSTDQFQSNYDHNFEAADIAVKKNPIPCLENLVWLMGLFHDAGKYSAVWQDYFLKNIKNPEERNGPKEDHTTAGGQLIEELALGSLLSQLIQTAIYSHHGLQDCVRPEDGKSLYIRRRDKALNLPVGECREQFFRNNDPKEIERRCSAAKEESHYLLKCIQDTMKLWTNPGLYGNRDFFLGMYERLLTSLLIDSDRRNTEDFMSGGDKASSYTETELQDIWKICVENVEKKIAEFQDKSGINTYRSQISEQCKAMSGNCNRLYQFTVPTGAGKTLSSLRFAVFHAEQLHKKRIIYAAPFHSIVEQNAEEIKNALGMREIVLEHHCNIVMEDEQEQADYDRLTEDWSSPVIVTTAVQLLNTLFAGKPGNVRRMHSLCDSIIIMDEVQALPIRVIELFNIAVNFLTEFANTTVVLCTATQPLLDKIPTNRLRPPKDLIQHSKDYREKLRRTEIIDATAQKTGGMNVREAAEFALEKEKEFGNVLLIVNTKACARRIFEELRTLCENEVEIYHLSTNMYPIHRSAVLEEIRNGLGGHRRLICVSTQLIEAGVDISFNSVIRSLAGLDSIIQSAGRCNRNGKEDLGFVYLIKMAEEAENLSYLRDIWIAQETMQSVLTQFNQNPESLDGRLDSEKAIRMYFERYYKYYLGKNEKAMSFPVTVCGVPANLVDLLSNNPEFAKKQKGHNKQMLKQAFKTAGEEFEVIADTGKISIIVPYEEVVEQKVQELEDPYLSWNKKKQILRELQPYTVSISQTEKNILGQGIRGVCEHRVLVLENRFYDPLIGITTDPAPMPDLQM